VIHCGKIVFTIFRSTRRAAFLDKGCAVWEMARQQEYPLMTTTRFAPSPTGYIHVGNLRTALFNYLIARKSGGTFILRIDDTDPERSKEIYVDALKQDLEWLGLTWDKVERQSHRLDRYAEAADDLRAKGRFYEAFETPTELDLKRKKQLNMGKPPVYDRAALALSDADKDKLRAERGDGVWRFKLDQERIEWSDGILGDISIDAASVSDPVLIRADKQILYTLASVVDDTEMGVTHVVRGSDHVTNTATQIQIIRALGGTEPSFAHHSLLTGPQGESLSKRLGTLSLRDLREQGVEPEALLSLMARLGSSQPVELRLTLDEIAEGFDLSQFGSAPTKFDVQDLFPLTARKLHALGVADVAGDLAALGVPSDKAEAFWTVARENITTRQDIAGWWTLCSEGAEPLVADEDAEFIAQAMALLPEGPFDASTWGTWTAAVKEVTGRKGKGLFMPLRKAITGQERGPEMSDLLPLLQTIPARKLAAS
jgi:glutamyl-tRNA synthetase